MKKFYKILSVLILLNSIILPFSGSGTFGDPYQVTTAAQLVEVASSLSSYYKQMNDIDISGYSNWTKIGSSTSSAFTGTYDGNGFKVTGLSITSTSTTGNGLFGVSTGTIKNLGVSGSISVSHNWAGLLVGNNYGGTVQNCYSTGSVTTSVNLAGGLLGNSTGTISKCYSTASVSATGSSSANIGGFIGGTGTVSSNISECYSTGNVTNSSTNTLGGLQTGGFAGMGVASISNCYSTGNVTCNSGYYAGGFIGRTGASGSITHTYTNCYSTGLVTCSSNPGGFLGWYISATVSGNHYDTQTSGTSNNIGGVQDGYTPPSTGIDGNTTAQMKTQSTFSGWDFTTVWEIVSGYYPRLRSNPDSALPVELTSFTTSFVDNKVILNWQTATEVNNYGFEIERSVILSPDFGGTKNLLTRDWQSLGFISGSGNSNSIKNYSFTDDLTCLASGNARQALNLNLTPIYRLKQIDIDGSYSYSKIVEVTSNLQPSTFELYQNYPNPFNPTTLIKFVIPSGTRNLNSQDSSPFGIRNDMMSVTLKIYDILGNEVATLVNEQKEPGYYEVEFNAAQLTSGVYFYVMRAGDEFNSIKKMLLLK